MENNYKKYGILYFMIWFFILIVARVFVYNAFDKHIEDYATRFLVSQIYRFFIWVVPVFLYLILVDKTKPFKYLKLTTSLKKGGIYCLILLGAGVVWQLLEIRFRGDTIGDISFISILGVVVIPLFEEILLRGFILNKLSEIMAFNKALFISAAYFLLLHLPGWLLIAPIMPAMQMLVFSFSVFAVVGLLSGILMRKSNSLYPSILLHAINNFISGI